MTSKEYARCASIFVGGHVCISVKVQCWMGEEAGYYQVRKSCESSLEHSPIDFFQPRVRQNLRSSVQKSNTSEDPILSVQSFTVRRRLLIDSTAWRIGNAVLKI